MTAFHTLDRDMLVAGQIGTADVAAAAAVGVTIIVNNRPDGEEAGQPESAAIEGAARAAGLTYRHLPVAGGVTPDQAQAMAAILNEAEGKVLAFCRSGTRSTYLWALAQRRRGADGAAIMAQAANAGYDLSPLGPLLLR